MKCTKSSKPKKQRRYHYEKSLHRKQESLAGHLDKKLREQLKTRSVALRKGDTVKVMEGKNKGKSGKVTEVNYKRGTVYVEKIIRKKANGEEVPLPIQASNLLVTDIDKSDGKRFKGKGIKIEKKENTNKENATEEKKQEMKEKKGNEEKKREPKKGK